MDKQKDRGLMALNARRGDVAKDKNSPKPRRRLTIASAWIILVTFEASLH